MAWYHGTYSCGHEGRINLIGPTKDREWKKEREFSGLCPECYKKNWKHRERQRTKLLKNFEGDGASRTFRFSKAGCMGQYSSSEIS